MSTGRDSRPQGSYDGRRSTAGQNLGGVFMTTTSAVAARHHAGCRGTEATDRTRRVTALVAALALGAVLAGCGSSNLLDSPSSQVQPVAATPAAATTPPATQSKVALAPVMGAPEAMSKQVGDQLTSSLQQKRVPIVAGSDRPDYTLRGYMVATRERAGTKVAYIFDLTDPTGKRVNRIQGEEVAQGGDARDPWSAVTPAVSQRIAEKAAGSLSASLASLTPGAQPAGGAPPVGVGAAPASQPSVAPAAPVAGGSTTGSIPRDTAAASTSVMVPAVSGAPGDGNTSLSSAMRQELQQSGVGVASPGQRSYSVTGKVTVGAVKEGKQPVKIDWRVQDPSGALLATVSQNNEIQAGALDGAWGNIANDAAQGAASRIKQIIDENQAGSGGRVGAQPTARTRG